MPTQYTDPMWSPRVPDQPFIQLLPGVDTRVFRHEADVNVDGVVVAFTYDNGTMAMFFCVFVGTQVELANWVHQNYKDVPDKYKSMLECTRGVEVCAAVDVEKILEADDDREKMVTEIRKGVTKLMKTHFLGALGGSIAGAAEDLRFFENHRMTDKGFKVSFHVISRSIVFSDWVTLGQYMHYAASKTPTLGLDLKIYNLGRKMRIKDSWKVSTQMTSVLTCVSDQAASHLPCDSIITAVPDGAKVWTLDDLEEAVPDFKGWADNSAGVVAIRPSHRRTGSLLNDVSTNVLSEHFRKSNDTGIRYVVGVSDKGYVTIKAQNRHFCFIRPGITHDHQQSVIFIDPLTMWMNVKCDGEQCGCTTPLVMESTRGVLALRLAAIQALGRDCFGTKLEDEYVQPLLPVPIESYNRVVCGDGCEFLIAPDHFIAISGSDLRVVDRETLTDSPIGVDYPHTEALISLLHRKEIQLGVSMFTVSMEKAKAALASRARVSIMDGIGWQYMLKMFEAKGYRTDDNGMIYEPHPDYPMLYRLTDQSLASREVREKAVKNHMNMYGTAAIKMLAKDWIPGKEFHRQYETSCGTSLMPSVKRSEALGFRTGVQFFPKSVSEIKGSIVEKYMTFEEMKADCMEPVAVLAFLDCDYNPLWATERHFTAMMQTFETQGWSDDTTDFNLAMAIGRVLLRWSLINDLDEWRVHVVLLWATAAGKSLIIDIIRMLTPPNMSPEISKQRTGLAAMQMFRDCVSRVIVGADMDLTNMDVYRKGLDTATFKKMASYEPVTATQLYEGKSGQEVIHSPLIAVFNSKHIGWLRATSSLADLMAVLERMVVLRYSVKPDTQDERIKRAALSPVQVGAIAIYSMQQYLKMRINGKVASDIQKLAAPARADIFEANSPLHAFLNHCVNAYKYAKDRHGPTDDEFKPTKPGIIYPCTGSYVTPSQLSDLVTQYMTKGNKQGGHTDKINCDDVRVFGPQIIPGLRVAYGTKTIDAKTRADVEGSSGEEGGDEKRIRVAHGIENFCRECYDSDVVFRKMGDKECPHPRKGCTNFKQIPSGSILDYSFTEIAKTA